jgi:hypothetical protein
MKKLSLVVVLFLVNLAIQAQCVMCRAVADSNTSLDDSNNIAEGLNSGILYLMAIPYVLLLTLGWVFFRQKIKAFLGFTK